MVIAVWWCRPQSARQASRHAGVSFRALCIRCSEAETPLPWEMFPLDVGPLTALSLADVLSARFSRHSPHRFPPGCVMTPAAAWNSGACRSVKLLSPFQVSWRGCRDMKSLRCIGASLNFGGSVWLPSASWLPPRGS